MTIFASLFALAGLALCVNAIAGWIPPEHPQLAGRDPNIPNEPVWSRWLATFDPKFRSDWAASRKWARIITFLLGIVFAVAGVVMLRQ